MATLLNSAYGKGSLTFVVDNTWSMSDDIQQIKDGVDSIFERLDTMEVQPYENFGLVTFNDPVVQVQVITKDREAFKRALHRIDTNGGGDCPEFALSGIKLAIQHSLPFSSLFVFTDASPKDYHKYEEVATLVNEKSVQLHFLLTGHCRSSYGTVNEVYNRLANLTGGFVSEIKKEDIANTLRLSVEADINRKIDAENATIKT